MVGIYRKRTKLNRICANKCKNNRAVKFGQITGSRIGYTSGYSTSEKSKDIASSRRRFLCRLLRYDRRQSGGDNRSGLPDHDTKDITGLALCANLSASSTCAICHNLIPTSARNSTTIFPSCSPHIDQSSATSWRVSSDKTSNRLCHPFATRQKRSDCTLPPTLLAD